MTARATADRASAIAVKITARAGPRACRIGASAANRSPRALPTIGATGTNSISASTSADRNAVSPGVAACRSCPRITATGASPRANSKISGSSDLIGPASSDNALPNAANSTVKPGPNASAIWAIPSITGISAFKIASNTGIKARPIRSRSANSSLRTSWPSRELISLFSRSKNPNRPPAPPAADTRPFTIPTMSTSSPPSVFSAARPSKMICFSPPSWRSSAIRAAQPSRVVPNPTVRSLNISSPTRVISRRIDRIGTRPLRRLLAAWAASSKIWSRSIRV